MNGPQYFVPISGTSAYIGPGLPGSTAATGTSAMLFYNLADAGYKWLQSQFIASTASSGALIRCQFVGKGWGV